MKWLTDTIAGRTMLVLLLGIGGVLLLANILYEIGFEKELKARDAARLADRLLVLKQTIGRLPPEERDDAAHSLSGGPIEVHWSKDPLANPGGTRDDLARDLRARLLASAPDLDGDRLILGSSPELPDLHKGQKPQDHLHTTLISLGLEDSSWINVSLTTLQGSRLSSPSFLFTLLAMSLGVGAVSILMARWLTRPLSDLTAATNLQFAGGSANAVPETGTREVRELGSAINELKRRIGRLLQDRTHMLAAVSHDLHTPLTRLRLRLEDISDDAARSSIEADLNEMEQMLDATLSFLKGEARDEEIQPIDLVAIVETIANDMTDASADVTVDGLRHAVIKGRRLALKRALTNIIQNAVKYGKLARINISDARNSFEITVTDQGPGIPEKDHEAAFAPFHRLEISRSKETGGYGLGLSVAQTIVRAHGGEIALQNLSPNGLSVGIRLPKTGGPNPST
jgi:two-component system, OmpR family, sensor kinase